MSVRVYLSEHTDLVGSGNIEELLLVHGIDLEKRDKGKERFDTKMSDLSSDLPKDIAEEVISRIPVTSLREVRSTCKNWNTLTKGESFLKRHTAKKKERRGIEVVMMLEYRVSLMSVDLLYPSVERIGNLDADGVDISKIFHCNGLFLCCITKDKDSSRLCFGKKDSSRLVVWNPYLGQTRWIEPRNSYHRWDRYAIGYDNEKKKHKVLRFVNYFDPSGKKRLFEFEMYSLNSNTWKVIDDFTTDWDIRFSHRGLSLKGNTYWYAHEMIPLDGPPERSGNIPDCLLSFDFTRERFGPSLPLPFHAFYGDIVTLSSVREEQLAVLFQDRYTVKIWITSKIEPNAVSWSNLFLAVDMKPRIGIRFRNYAASFFVDEEEKVAVVLDKDRSRFRPATRNIAYIIGNNGCLKQVDLGEARDDCCYPLVCSYVPSSVQLHN